MAPNLISSAAEPQKGANTTVLPLKILVFCVHVSDNSIHVHVVS